ncbi:MAG: L-histidine N(alpha)-methyltransferase [Chitinivibrionales bacterium]|nr:L-histidine N(alpha)-methyltransferase [Chitinivibrionales bacterium]MBD3355623.1 L-histidine N(alpha)-methyltransferase [Chitinivibrionales bacterium]
MSYDEVTAELSGEDKCLSSKYLYDKRGSELFERICGLEEYYPTRTETAIMQKALPEIASIIGPECLLIEYGSGSSTKTRLLLDKLCAPCAYMPIDISAQFLEQTAKLLKATYPSITILPLCADFTALNALPELKVNHRRKIAFFPGSTIGNFDPRNAVELLKRISSTCGEGGGLLIGVDLKKDPEILWRAYNDSQGVTAAFNKNVLVRLNRELGADFDLDKFNHWAPYIEDKGRVEMRLVSSAEQTVSIGETAIHFERDEYIRTECSYKFSVGGFHALAHDAGYEVTGVWLDPQKLFSVHFLTVTV